jgi:hypothetical protein
MIHRVRINRKRLLGPDYNIVSASTTTWVSGETLDQQWTNANTYPTPKYPNNYPNLVTPTNVTNTVPFDQTLYSKSIVIPLEMKFEPADYSDLIDDWVNSETQRVINQILDGEKVKYSSDQLSGITISFRFSDRTQAPNGPYTTEYAGNGFSLPEEFKLNKFKKSYFRLYFYDSNNSETSNLLFIEDLPVQQAKDYGPKVTDAVFTLKDLYWDKEDPLMDNTLTNRVIYMEARFFNAKTGQVQTFYNLPTTKSSPIGISEYSNVNNRAWRMAPITLKNPNNNQGEYRFEVLAGAGGNTSTSITLSEFILT